MHGVITHVSDPKRRTTFTAALKNIPETQVFATYRPNILDIRPLFVRGFQKLATTEGQS